MVERMLSSGEYVGEAPILTIAQIDPLNVEVIVPVEKIGFIAVGADATVQEGPGRQDGGHGAAGPRAAHGAVARGTWRRAARSAADTQLRRLSAI